jgi:hypothetical protein
MSIPKEEAESYIRNYMALQDSLRASNGLEQVENPEARAYYNTDYISFVFEKNRIDALFASHPEADALRIYYAAHSNGDPTLVLVLAQMNVNNTLFSNMSATDTREQWPGGKGTRGGGGISGFDLDKDPIY